LISLFPQSLSSGSLLKRNSLKNKKGWIEILPRFKNPISYEKPGQ
jgi:hypothetical protein